MPTIEIKDIKANYGFKEILHNVSLSANDGECIGVLGYNGCGKSTFLSILAGIKKPTDGLIKFNDETLFSKSEGIWAKKAFHRYTGYVPQENPLIPELSVYDNLKLWYPSKAALNEALETGFLHTLGIKDFVKKNVNQLSGGMKKRISIGIATIDNPKLLILDEPSAALDLACKEDIRKYLSEYMAKGNIVIITTHEDSELELCTGLTIIKDGLSTQVDKSLRGNELVKVF